MASKEPPAQVRIVLPDWLWGGTPTRLVAECRYRCREDGSGGYLLQTEEAYRRQAPDLVRVKTIAGPTMKSPRYEDLGRLREKIDLPVPDQLPEVLDRRRRRAEESGEPIDLFMHQTLLLYALKVSELPTQSRYFHESLKEMTFTEDPTDGPFRNSGVHLIEINPALHHRLKIASVWLRIEYDRELSSGYVSHLQATIGQHEQAFSSSAGLYSGTYLFDAYLGPLLAAGSPGVWALNVPRTCGSLIFTLGSFVSGTKNEAAEMLQLISVPGATEAVPFPQLTAEASAAAVQWWGEQLNRVFGVLSDLAVFSDQSGTYVPAKHLQAMLTIEQIFRRATSLLLSHRDTNARRTLLFTLLDSLEAVTGIDLVTMCKLGHAETVLDRLNKAMPASAAEILLPAARRATNALKQMQHGFFLRRHLGTDDLELHVDSNTPKHMTLENGVARYLKILRDATHGHGSNRKATVRQTEALLAHHDGNVPHDIGLLAYLYLLDLITNPDRLRRVLYRNGR